jgi:hypothetical protein
LVWKEPVISCLWFSTGKLKLEVYPEKILEMETFLKCLGLLNLLDYNIKFMMHDLLLPEVKYQTVLQRKGQKSN